MHDTESEPEPEPVLSRYPVKHRVRAIVIAIVIVIVIVIVIAIVITESRASLRLGDWPGRICQMPNAKFPAQCRCNIIRGRDERWIRIMDSRRRSAARR